MSTDAKKKQIASLKESIDRLSSKILLCKNSREKVTTELVLDGLKKKLERLKSGT